MKLLRDTRHHHVRIKTIHENAQGVLSALIATRVASVQLHMDCIGTIQPMQHIGAYVRGWNLSILICESGVIQMGMERMNENGDMVSNEKTFPEVKDFNFYLNQL